MPKIRYLHKTRREMPGMYARNPSIILQNMNFSRYYRYMAQLIYSFDLNIILFTDFSSRLTSDNFRRLYVLVLCIPLLSGTYLVLEMHSPDCRPVLQYGESPSPYGEGLYFQPDHLYTTYRSVVDFVYTYILV